MQTFSASESIHDYFFPLRAHVLTRIDQATISHEPFYHTFIEHFFPADFYEELRSYMLSCKCSGSLQDRNQDNPAYTNRRFSLFHSEDAIVKCIRQVFSDFEVKLAFLEKFYISPSPEFVGSLLLHEEFEFVFTQAGRFQNIHVDIPPKFLSFVFYIPEVPIPSSEESRNGTIMYDKALLPYYAARFRENSVCVFAPHFYSYHGFSSTVDRDVLVAFYIQADELVRWGSLSSARRDTPPFPGLLDSIERKLTLYPLIEYGNGLDKFRHERAACLVNAPHGRVLGPAANDLVDRTQGAD